MNRRKVSQGMARSCRGVTVLNGMQRDMYTMLKQLDAPEKYG